MKFQIQRSYLIKPLQNIIAIADKKHTIAILNNFLCSVQNGIVTFKASDLETEIVAFLTLDSSYEEGETTIPARKFADIVKSFSSDTQIKVETKEGAAVNVRAGRSRFNLATLDATSFPNMAEQTIKHQFKLSQASLSRAIRKVQFAMAANDVRYFLNGTLWELEDNTFKTVATDGHRMALCETQLNERDFSYLQLIVPKKSIPELQRLMNHHDETKVEVGVGGQFVQIQLPGYTFTSKIIDGRYPDYSRVIPQNNRKRMLADVAQLKQALIRTSILSNEKYRGVRLNLTRNLLKLAANNPDQEEAYDELEVDYQDEPIEIGFNVNYLLDVLSVIETEKVSLFFQNSSMSVLIYEHQRKDCAFVIMPVRL